MDTNVLTPTTLEVLRQRRQAGERVSVLAAELGLPWQKLEKAIRRGVPVQPAGTGPLTERYRPQRLCELVGQSTAVQVLRQFVRQPYPMALLFDGETGTGKTSAALALAAELGCECQQREIGGLHVIASGEQTADAVRELFRQLWNRPFFGSGWKVAVINEADRMSPAAETVWLDRLEDLPAHVVLVFTTNHPGRLSQRFRDRCTSVHFGSEPAMQVVAARALLAAVWKRETGRALPAEVAKGLAEQAVESGHLSFRRAMQILQVHLMKDGVQ